MSYANSVSVLPKSLAHYVRLSCLQTSGPVWVTIATAFGLLVAMSAWLDIRPLGYEKATVAATAFLGTALVLNTMTSWLALRAALLCEALALLVLGCSVSLYLSYEMQTLALPLQDARFAAWDKSLGLDYENFLAWFDRHDIAVKILHRAYYSFRWQILGTTVVLALLGDARKLGAFLGALLLALLCCCVVGAIFPAAGAISLLSAQELSALHWRIDGATPIDHLMKLREGDFRQLDLKQLGGIISFPSFHAATALIVAQAWSRWTYLFVPVCILNVLMAAATLTQGGHYLVDTLAGLVLAAACLYVVNVMQRRGDA